MDVRLHGPQINLLSVAFFSKNTQVGSGTTDHLAIGGWHDPAGPAGSLRRPLTGY